jgi:hypothetical protein
VAYNIYLRWEERGTRKTRMGTERLNQRTTRIQTQVAEWNANRVNESLKGYPRCSPAPPPPLLGNPLPSHPHLCRQVGLVAAILMVVLNRHNRMTWSAGAPGSSVPMLAPITSPHRLDGRDRQGAARRYLPAGAGIGTQPGHPPQRLEPITEPLSSHSYIPTCTLTCGHAGGFPGPGLGDLAPVLTGGGNPSYPILWKG